MASHSPTIGLSSLLRETYDSDEEDKYESCPASAMKSIFSGITKFLVLIFVLGFIASVAVPVALGKGRIPIYPLPKSTISERVTRILHKTPLIDGHNDLAILIRFLSKNKIHTANIKHDFEKGRNAGFVDVFSIRFSAKSVERCAKSLARGLGLGIKDSSLATKEEELKILHFTQQPPRPGASPPPRPGYSPPPGLGHSCPISLTDITTIWAYQHAHHNVFPCPLRGYLTSTSTAVDSYLAATADQSERYLRTRLRYEELLSTGSLVNFKSFFLS